MEHIHTHQHRLDRNHNVLLLLIPGFVFALVIGSYILLKQELPSASFSSTEAMNEIE